MCTWISYCQMLSTMFMTVPMPCMSTEWQKYLELNRRRKSCNGFQGGTGLKKYLGVNMRRKLCNGFRGGKGLKDSMYQRRNPIIIRYPVILHITSSRLILFWEWSCPRS